MTEARELVEKLQAMILHVFKEGNILADELASTAFDEEGKKKYKSNSQLPSQCKKTTIHGQKVDWILTH